MYPSDAYPVTKARRIKRIRRRACAELIRTYENGEISLRQFDLVSRFSRQQQKRVLAEGRQQIENQRLAASAINRFLDNGKEINLSQICAAISGTVFHA